MLSVGINLTSGFREKVKNVMFTDARIHRQRDRTYKHRTNSDPKKITSAHNDGDLKIFK